MNMLDIQDKLKGLSEQQLVQAMQAPTENVPQFLVLSEITRRKRMRDSMAAQESSGMTVAQEAVAAAGVPQGGISDMARALAPKTDMAQNTGVSPEQGMYGGGYVERMYGGGHVKKMAAGDLIIRDGKRYVEQEDGSYLGDDGIPVDLDLTADDRTFGQRYIGDPLRDLFKPVGDSMRETLEPVGESMRETMQPVGGDLTQLFRGKPQEGYSFVPPSDPRLAPQPLTYDQIMSRARSGSMPSPDQLQSSVEAGLLSGQQAADVQAMTEGTGYIPDSQEVSAAKAPGMSPVIPDDPRVVTDPYRLTSVRTRAGQTIDDYVSGILGDRTVGGQSSIDAARKAAIEETVSPDNRQSPAFENRGREQSPTDAIEAIAAQTEAAKAAEEAAKKAAADDATASDKPRGPSGGGIGGASGATSYERELMDAMDRAERRARQDKWMAVAQVGLKLMSSTQPTLGGALGEAGLAGLESYRDARDAYEQERLGFSKELSSIESARASQRAAASKAAAGPTPQARMKAIRDEMDFLMVEDEFGKSAPRQGFEDRAAQLLDEYNSLLGEMYGNPSFDATAQ
jgi:hypothetical protein